MFTEPLKIIFDNGMFTLIAFVALGALIYVWVQPILSGENATEERIAIYKKTPVIAARRRGKMTAEQRRRQMIEDGMRNATSTGKDDDSIETMLVQSGLGWTKRQFNTYSLIFGFIIGVIVFVLMGMTMMSAYMGIAAGAIAGVFLPKKFVAFKRKKRFKAFTDELPNALDIITRGLKSGLHTNQCIRIISAESKEPVASEFGLVCDAQAIGISMSDAVAKLADRMPTPETNFFSIAVSLQSKNGGRLGEALENLSRTLRQRKNMHGEIKALSMEAKASSVIIGSMPFIIITLVYFSSPDYILPLFTTTAGKVGLCVALCWMAMGITLITKMSNIKV